MVHRGNMLSSEQVSSEPKVSFPTDRTDAGSKWALAMVDADAANGPKLHWLKTNIESGENVSAGDIAVPYSAGFPEFNDGVHRYVFVLLNQGGTTLNLDSSIADTAFSLTDFISQHNLVANGLAFHRAESDVEPPAKSTGREGGEQSRYTNL